MTSVLAAQLAALPGGPAPGPKRKKAKGKASLLFTPQQAADLSAEDVYELGSEGFAQLCAMDARFEEFGRLFAPGAGAGPVREALTPEEARRHDAGVAGFASLLSGYFLLPPAFKALEYLVQRYKVHKHNAGALLRGALPYHATNEFVRLVQILEGLEGGPFAFLVPMQASGASLPRDMLVTRCLTDRALLEVVCQLAQAQGSTTGGGGGQVALAFYAATLCEVVGRLGAKHAVDEPLVSFLLPYLLAGLAPAASPDYHAATYMLLCQLSSQTSFGAELVSALIIELCRSLVPSLLPQAVLALAHLAATQRSLASLPDRAFKHLAKLPALAEALADLVEQSGPAASPLLALVVRATAAAVARGQPNYARLALALASRVPLGTEVATLARGVLDTAASEAAGDKEVGGLLTRAACALERRYPEAMDTAVNAALKALAPSSSEDLREKAEKKGDKKMKKKKKKKKGREADEVEEEEGGKAGAMAQRRQRLLTFLEHAFSHSLAVPLAEAGTTLALALDAASAGIRQMALERVDVLASDAADKGDAEVLAALQSAVLRRLADDSPGVVLAALQLRSLTALPPALLGEALERAYFDSLAKAASSTATKTDRAAARGVARKSLKLLAGTFLAAHPSTVPHVLPVLLSALVDVPWPSLWATAAKAAAKLQHPLLAGLKDVQAPAAVKGDQGDGGDAATTAALGLAVVCALAVQAAKDSEAADAVQALALSPEGQRSVAVLLVAHAAMHTDGGRLAAALFRALAAGKWACTEGAAPPAGANFDAATGLPSPEWMVAVGSRHASPAELEAALAAAVLKMVPGEELRSTGVEVLRRLAASLSEARQLALLGALLARVEEVQPAAYFLSDWFAAPAEAAPLQLVTDSLNLYERWLMGLPAGGLPAVSGITAAVLLRLLSALAHPDAAARAAALAACQALERGCRGRGGWGKASEALLPAADATAVLKALAQQRVALETDPAAVERLLDGALASASAEVGSEGLGLPSDRAASLRLFLLRSLAEPGTIAPLSPATFHALRFLVRRFAPADSEEAGEEVVGAAVCALQQFAVSSAGTAQPLLSEPAAAAAAELVALCSPARLLAVVGADSEATSTALAVLLALAQSVGVQGAAAARLAALQQLTSPVFEVLDVSWKERVLQALLEGAARDDDDACRVAATGLLRALPLNAATLARLLAGAAAQPEAEVTGAAAAAATPAQGACKAKAAKQQEPAALRPATTQPGAQATAASVLELVLLRQDVQEAALLVPPTQALLAGLLDTLVAGQVMESGEGGEGEADEAEKAGAAAASGQSVYLVQLCLSALGALAERAGLAAQQAVSPKATATTRKKRAQQQQAASAGAFDLGLAVRAAQAAPDSTTRAFALALIARLAAGSPEAVLKHALAIVAVVGESSALAADDCSNAAAAAALAAVVPAWLASNRSLVQLVEVVVGAAAGMPPQRRLPTLAALAGALPEVSGLATMVLVLLQSASKEQAAAGHDAGISGVTEVPWSITAAAALLKRVSPVAMAQSTTSVLQQSMEDEEQLAAVTLLAVGLLASCLQPREGRPAIAGEEALAAWSELVQQVLLALQHWAAAPASGSGAAERIAAAGVEACFQLLEALRSCMAPAAYLRCLALVISGSTADKVQRRALGLLAALVTEEAVGAEEEDREEVAVAALAACDVVLSLASVAWQGPAGKEGQRVTLATSQAALAALGALAIAFGGQHPQHFAAVLRLLLPALEHADVAVRSSCCATLAAVGPAIGVHLVPLLPAVLPAILGMAQARLASMSQAAEEEDSEGREGNISEAAALELAAALAVLAALADSLGPYLAPHMPALLGVLLYGRVLEAGGGHVSESTAAIRRALAASVPPRLLVPALLAAVEPAVQAGAPSVAALLDMLSAALGHVPTPEVAGLADPVSTALLQVLDLRRTGVPSWQGADYDRAEAAAVASLTGLVMRLSETRFRPLLFRLVDWAASPPVAEGASLTVGTLARRLGLFAVVNSLAERLRGVFAPYFRQLLDTCVAALTSPGSGDSAAGGKKKRRKKGSDAAAPAGSEDAAAALDASEDGWRLRLRVVRALHRAFLYDAAPGAEGRLLDEALFERLLPALTAQLPLAPTPGSAAAAAVAREAAADGALDAALAAAGEAAVAALGEEGSEDSEEGGLVVDAFGRAVVGCLAQLGVACASDTQWKPLNHALLMATRALEPRTRLVALTGVAQLAGRLAEEYLVLLPETLPFLAELLEDAEQPVEASAAALLRALEALSGESLAEYLK